MNYYNENDPLAADWLKRLINKGKIPNGYVDQRSIEDVEPGDLEGYSQCHFFVGIGGWSRALELAGWPEHRAVWTGSCPCQPFSSAGKGKGTADKRHLWPEFYRLIRQCRPPAVFGEQVSGKAGMQWLDHVQDDLENSGYAVGAVTFPACSVGAPHQRQRLYWLADAKHDGHDRPEGDASKQGGNRQDNGISVRNGAVGSLADANNAGLPLRTCKQGVGGWETAGPQGEIAANDCNAPDHRSPTNGFWSACDWIYCRDEKWRPAEPGIEPLVDGLPGRVGLLRGYGNAIVPQQAAVFIETAMEVV